MENNQYVYLRFPVQILKCEFGNMKKLCGDAITYGIIEHMERKNYSGWKGYGTSLYELGMNAGFKRSDYSDQPKNAIDYLEETHFTKWYDRDRKIYNEYKDSIDKPITCSIKRILLFEFMNKPKSEFEIAVFRFFIALNSIQGTKEHGQATYDRIFAVSFGYNTDKVLKHGLGKREKIDLDLFKTDKEREVYQKYSTQHNRQRIVETLELHWYLKWVGATYDGNFFSFTKGYKALNTIKSMAIIKRKKPKEKLKSDKKKGKEESDKELKNNTL